MKRRCISKVRGQHAASTEPTSDSASLEENIQILKEQVYKTNKNILKPENT